MKNTHSPEMVDLRQAAQILNLPSSRSVMRYVRLGRLPKPVFWGGKNQFCKSTLLEVTKRLQYEASLGSSKPGSPWLPDMDDRAERADDGSGRRKG